MACGRKDYEDYLNKKSKKRNCRKRLYLYGRFDKISIYSV